MYLIPASAVCEDMLISIHDEIGVTRSSASSDFDDELDVVSAHGGRPTQGEILNAFDVCEISSPDESVNDGMTIIALEDSKILVIYYRDDQTLIRAHDHG